MSTVGRPPKFDTPEQMQVAIDAYFDSRDDANRPTVTGLALALDMTRKTLMEYEGDNEFSNTVKKAKARVEEFMENRLYDPQATGTIFNLKNNFGWEDRTKSEHMGEGGAAFPAVILQPVAPPDRSDEG